MSHLGAYATKASHQCKTESNEGLVFVCLSCLHELCFWLFFVIKLIIYYSLSFQKVTLNLNNTLFWGEFQDRGRIWTVHTNISYQHCTVGSRLCVLRGKKSYSCKRQQRSYKIKSFLTSCDVLVISCLSYPSQNQSHAADLSWLVWSNGTNHLYTRS